MALQQPTFSILSCDGGGIRGIIPCVVLVEIEKRTGRPICELFDLMAGTSTGGILSAGLSVAGADGKPKFRAQDLLELYLNRGKEIFTPPGGIFKGLRMLFNAKFPEKNIDPLLREYFGDARLKDTLTPILITSYETQHKTPFYFKTTLAREKPELEDFYIRDVTRSTSAAPTYFPPNRIGVKGPGYDHLSLVDGGVFANNPSLLAYIEGRQMWKNRKGYTAMAAETREAIKEAASRDMVAEVAEDDYEAPFLFISIGTGHTKRPYPYDDARKWGAIKWIQPIIDILMQGVSESVHYQMQYLLPKFTNGNPRYYRLNVELAPGDSDMDNVEPENLNKLIDYGQKIVKDNDAHLDRICRTLEFISEQREK